MGIVKQDKGLLGRIRASVKYLITGEGGSSPFYFGTDYRYGTTIDYRQRAGELTENAIVMACVRWIMINFAMPTRVMRKVPGPAKDTEVESHRLVQLLTRPNQDYSGELLLRSTALSLSLANNAYWIWYPNRAGMPVELRYEPHHTIRAVYPSQVNSAGQYDPNTDFISYYEIYREGRWFRIEREYVIHFRDSLDPRNPRMGLFVLGAALREIYTDNEAAAYTATILQNMGVSGMIVSPEGDGMINDPAGLKRHIMATTQGDHRGEPTVFSSAVKVDIPGYSPQQMQVGDIRNIPEERIAALLGPGLIIAAGLGAGLDHGTFHNYGEAVASAFRNNIMPTHRIVASEINSKLLPYLGDPSREYLEFDLTEVPELQEDQQAKSKRITEAVKVGMPIYANEMREINGLPPIDDLKDTLVIPPPFIVSTPLGAPEPDPATQQQQPQITDVTNSPQDAGAQPAQLPPGKAYREYTVTEIRDIASQHGVHVNVDALTWGKKQELNDWVNNLVKARGEGNGHNDN